MVDDKEIQKMVDAIVREVDPEQVIIFGSYAKGMAQSYSDVDFIVIESESFGSGRSRWEELSRIWDALSHFRVPHDVLVFSNEDVERWRSSINNILARALREGKVLYERH